MRIKNSLSFNAKHGCIMVDLNYKELRKVCRIINLYGKYWEIKAFWEGLGEVDTLKGENVIVRGDLNLT
jgi:hypothetical protein